MSRTALAIVLAATLGCQGRPRSVRDGARSAEPRSGPTVVVLDLSAGVPEQAQGGWLGLSQRSASIEDLVDYVSSGASPAEVRGVLVRLGEGMGLGRAAEVGALLATLRARWPVWCYADDYTNASLYVAARGCQRAWAPPAGGVEAIGLAAQTLYFHKLLADELGLDVDFLQVGKYKGAEEPFTRDGPSPDARESLESTLTALRADWLAGIRSGRPEADAAGLEDGPYSAQEAKQRGLIDAVGYFDDARTAIERATGAVRSETMIGDGSSSRAAGDLTEALRILVGGPMEARPVMIVRATGAITLDGSSPFGGGGIVERRLAATLSKLEKDRRVKAVVLRIDSPGGSALASDLLWHDLMRLRAAKTLVVSIGDMAASGGYYLASSGAAVIADETSIVGSIGVVGGKIAAEHALDKIGIHAETFSARAGDVHAEARAAYESPLMAWDEATRTRVLASMYQVYQLFLNRVSEGRHMALDRVAASAEGQIFGGRQALARGLIDATGGLREAVDRARQLANLPSDAPVGVAEEPTGIFEILSDESEKGGARRSSAGLLVAVPSLVPFVASLAPMIREEPVLCALPFALTVR